jgi:heme/copper-type cytochrome/quinol oxidase subunit 2
MKEKMLVGCSAMKYLANKKKLENEVTHKSMRIIKIAGAIIVLGVIVVVALKYLSMYRDNLIEDEYYEDDETISYFTSDEDFEVQA